MDTFQNEGDFAKALAEVEAEIIALIDTFGFDTTIEGRSVAEGAIEMFIVGVTEMVAALKCPDESDMPPINEAYAAEKLQQYGTDATGWRTGQMLSVVSLRGHTVIQHNTVTINYGTGDPPTRGSGPAGYLSERDKLVTDQDKAQWFTDGFMGTVSYTTKTGKAVSYEANRPPRPFFGANLQTEEWVFESIRDDLYKYLGDKWGK